jgi:hypothetical protein
MITTFGKLKPTDVFVELDGWHYMKVNPFAAGTDNVIYNCLNIDNGSPGDFSAELFPWNYACFRTDDYEVCKVKKYKHE